MQEKLDELKAKQHKLAVFYHLVEHMDEQLTVDDARPEPKVALTAEDCAEPKVSQEAIEAVREQLMHDFVGPLETEIGKILEAEV